MKSNNRGGITDMATSNGLEVLGFRIPVEKIFSGLIQTGLGGHPASCAMGIYSFSGIKRPERGANHVPII
jgi:hypothetical protein